MIALRVVMGAAAAFIYPTTLSIISQTFTERAARAKAIGAWGAVTGVGVAVGPIAGGALLEQFSWRSVFAALIPVALLAPSARSSWCRAARRPRPTRSTYAA